MLGRYRMAAGAEIEWSPLLPTGGDRISTVLRNSLGYAHLCWADTAAMRRLRALPVRAPTMGRRAMVYTARVVGRAAASPQGIALLERWHQRIAGRDPAVEHYRQLFRRLGASIVFCTHQRPPSIVAPVLAAKSLGVPTATFIFSWDNLTTKGRIAAPFDHYFVWSRHMQDELLRYYPDVGIDQVHVLGAPQFDPYGDPALRWSREEFFRRIGARREAKLICYSGGDTSTCPEDPAHLQILLDLVRSGRLEAPVQVVLRPSPVDDAKRFAALRRAYPELLFAPPAWSGAEAGDWARVMPLADDVQLLANLTYHCDVNVNNASTMTLDFAIHDRPVVNVAFDVASPAPLGMPVWDLYYQFEHYRPVLELGAARVARSPDELAAHLNAYLARPELDRENRRRLVELEILLPIGEAGRRIVKTLESLQARDQLQGAGQLHR